MTICKAILLTLLVILCIIIMRCSYLAEIYSKLDIDKARKYGVVVYIAGGFAIWLLFLI